MEILQGIPYVDLSRKKTVTSRGKKWTMISCPLAAKTHSKGTDRNPSFGISEDGFFHCFSCHCKGKLSKLLYILEDFYGLDLSNRIQEVKNFERETVDSILAKERKPVERLILNENALIWPSALEYLEARDYLGGRGINASQVKFWDIRYDESKKMVVFPVRTLGLNGAVGRSVQGKVHHNYFGFATSECLGGYDKLSDNPRIAVMEGFFDVVSAFPIARKHGFDVVCTITSSCSAVQSELLENTDKQVYCGYHCDPAGDTGWDKMKARFPLASRFRWVGPKDFNDMTEEQLERVFTV